jgi:poly(A) polymerase/tRNA nucleotidyltransferase (CCA-adding enzyme)
VTLASWQREILEEGDLYRVGGSVRDRILDPGIEPPDTDFLVRALPPQRLEAILKRHGRLVLVGRAFGVYRFTPEGGRAVDIVYPRLERSTGPGHRDFDVKWDWQLGVEEDLRRRDFTVNAIAEHVGSGRRIDPAGGERDLRARLLRVMFAGAFQEDPLRILRGVRFAAQLNLRVEAETHRLMAASVDRLDTLSAERVQEEFSKTLTRCGMPSRAFTLARELGALKQVLPELDRCAGVEQNVFHPDDVFVHSLKTCDQVARDKLLVRWAALMHDVGKVDTRRILADDHGERVVFYGHEKVSAQSARAALRRLRYPNAFVRDCVHLVTHHMFNYESAWKDSTVRRFIRSVGEDRLDDLFALREADCRSRGLTAEIDNLGELRARVRAQLAQRHTLTERDLEIDGRDVMRELGIGPGPEVGKLLRELLERVLDDPSLNERDRLLAALRTGSGNGGKQKNRKPS